MLRIWFESLTESYRRGGPMLSLSADPGFAAWQWDYLKVSEHVAPRQELHHRDESRW
ncbi:hypothetical protein [Mycobacterium sp.]|uniref:hypothetical protein n=1 Tax=Mycobacterium sp. TaxID=1785 RepID=UPI003BA91BF5